MPSAISTVTLQELSALTQPNHHVIDIRSPLEYGSGHFKNAVNIPYDVLMTYPDSYLKKGEYYYLVCAHGALSYRASIILQSFGYHVASVRNGYEMRYCYC